MREAKTMTIDEFITARLEEDHELARAASATRTVLAAADELVADYEVPGIAARIEWAVASIWSDHPDYNPDWRQSADWELL
jgi:hypothetical protein